MGYFYDGGIEPGTQGTSTHKIGLTNLDMASNKELNNESNEALWLAIDENRRLKERLYKLEAKMNRLKEIIKSYE